MSDSVDLVVTRQTDGLTMVLLPEKGLAEGFLPGTRDKLMDIVDGIGDGELHLDFAQVVYLDSSALASLVTLHRRAALTRGRIVCHHLAPDLLKLFRLTR